MNKYKFIDFFIKIDKIYPDGLVNNLKKHKLLYKEAKVIAKYESATLKELFESNGYRYIYKDISKIRRELKKEIASYANTNNSLDNLHLLDSALYYKTLRYAELEEMTVVEYIEFLGFNYNKKIERKKVKTVKDELMDLYPNKRVSRLSMINNRLYSKIYKLAKKEDLSVNEYLIRIGFFVI